MKKYLILLIIPFLFFSIGCNNDEDDNDDLIPVSEYQESILGHWEREVFESTVTVITQTIQIDPVYGTETSNEFSSTYSWLEIYGGPYDSEWVESVVEYYTFKYDGTLNYVRNMYPEPPNSWGFPIFEYGFYEINEDYLNTTIPQKGHYGYIQNFTNSSFTLNKTTIDTTEIVNNSYSIIETSENYFFERIEESDIPTSN